MPTQDEARQLADMRRKIAAFYGWEADYVKTNTVRDRYQELMELKELKKK